MNSLNVMKKTLKLNFYLNVCEYTIVYLIKSFVIWEFKNPFEWIINLPTYAAQDRFMIFFIIVMWQGMQILFIHPKGINVLDR